ncbi:MAG: C69 family dipeptidase [Bacteroidales bacterium]|nr:C69 family dipeptidase [Bacteroidales bacterium]
MKYRVIFLAVLAVLCHGYRAGACSNVIVTRGASADGSCMVSYAADSHWLYGELYFHQAGRHKAGTRLPITNWDTFQPMGTIPQVPFTYQTAGNQNQHQLIIGETTWGGREEQVDSTGIMDYGSLIYVTLQRARTAREAIATIVELADTYGYPSEGETFSIADTQEAWVMDLVGKGRDEKGIVWVARRIPDGYICAHANQARITRFPLDDPENCRYAPDVIDYARRKGWFSGEDAEFSFRDAYNPLDYSGARACEARVWSAFRLLCDDVFTYMEGNREVSRPAGDFLSYAMGYDLAGDMPLFVKPARKLTPKDVADVMRDHFEGTPMDMREGIGAGGNACPYRWKPLRFAADGKRYYHERAIATQQTGFWFVAQARGWLPDEIGALQWFGVDDAATSYLTPVYTNTSRVPECLRAGNGNLLSYSPTSQFWICNRVANACYKMYNYMAAFVRERADAFEREQMFEKVPQMDSCLLAMSGRKRLKALTDYTVRTAQGQFDAWVKLEETLLVKFLDGNINAQNPDGSFRHSPHFAGFPEDLRFPGYTEFWKEAMARDRGELLEER